eukprot:6177665-Pleurochrysis_carterae.AAC.3
MAQALDTVLNVSLPSISLLEAATPRGLVHFAQQRQMQSLRTDLAASVSSQRLECTELQRGGKLELLSASGRWPGGCHDAQLPHLQKVADAGGDAIGGTSAALGRWEMMSASSSSFELLPEPLRHGGLVYGADRFDSHIFGISAAE